MGSMTSRNFKFEKGEFEQIKFLKVDENEKIILLWTNYFGQNWFSVNGIGELPGNDDSNSSATCFFTSDRSKLGKSSAVVFHGRDFNFNDLPKARTNWQRWVFHMMEAPPNSGFNEQQWAAATKLGFNWTMTYTSKSDIFCPYCHIDEIQLPSNRIEKTNLIRNRTQNWVQNFSNRSRDALWIVSNCGAENKRDELAEELRKNGIQVDSFGGCSGKRPDPIVDKIGPEAFYSKYKFYLALENYLCDDYASLLLLK